jgi:Arm domain-containing DNA-binding protein
MTAHATSRTIGSWGGRRMGAGRKPKLARESKRKIASAYLARRQKRRKSGDAPRREAIIADLAAKFDTTPRMVRRSLDEWLKPTRWNAKMWRATEGAEVQPLPARNINKLPPGVYLERNKKLRLKVSSTGKRTWIFQFCWGSTIHDMVLGDHPKMTLTMARKLATKASRELATGQNPIDGSWSSGALQSAKNLISG